MTKEKMSYGQYLKIDDLLELQDPLSDSCEHDEMLFIIIHQSFELWFKQMLHEFCYIQENMDKQASVTVLSANLRRVLTILKMIVSKFDVLETMTPTGYLTFRDSLLNSSGFQSIQFRQFELLFGTYAASALKNEALSEEERQTLIDSAQQKTLWESVIAYLQHDEPRLNAAVRLERDGFMFDGDDHNQLLFVELIKAKPDVAYLCELLVDIDEGIQEWRYRHVKMVERIIGYKKGTGGSAGVDYLRSTLHHQAFPDLWAIRNLI